MKIARLVKGNVNLGKLTAAMLDLMRGYLYSAAVSFDVAEAA